MSGGHVGGFGDVSREVVEGFWDVLHPVFSGFAFAALGLVLHGAGAVWEDEFPSVRSHRLKVVSIVVGEVGRVRIFCGGVSCQKGKNVCTVDALRRKCGAGDGGEGG